MLRNVSMSKALIRAIFLVPQVLRLDHYFGCNLHYAKLLLYSAPAESNPTAVERRHSATDFVYPAVWVGSSMALVDILLLSRPPHILLIFPCVKEKYLTSGWFSGCKLFLFVHSYIFLTCSNPGLASLSCIVKIKHPRHSTTRLNC